MLTKLSINPTIATVERKAFMENAISIRVNRVKCWRSSLEFIIFIFSMNCERMCFSSLSIWFQRPFILRRRKIIVVCRLSDKMYVSTATHLINFLNQMITYLPLHIDVKSSNTRTFLIWIDYSSSMIDKYHHVMNRLFAYVSCICVSFCNSIILWAFKLMYYLRSCEGKKKGKKSIVDTVVCAVQIPI